MASFFNHGTVIEGAYKGDFVYGLYEKQLHLFDTTSIKSWKYNMPGSSTTSRRKRMPQSSDASMNWQKRIM